MQKMTMLEAYDSDNLMCIVSDSLGIYMPQHFAYHFGKRFGLDKETIEILEAGPEHEHYWDMWCEVIDYATFTGQLDDKPRTWALMQDGDLYAVSTEVEISDWM